MQDKLNTKQLLTLENRKLLTLTGVSDVISSDENAVRLNTSCGKMIITGSGLSIGKISTESGEFTLSGTVNKIEYKAAKKSSSVAALFR